MTVHLSIRTLYKHLKFVSKQTVWPWRERCPDKPRLWVQSLVRARRRINKWAHAPGSGVSLSLSFSLSPKSINEFFFKYCVPCLPHSLMSSSPALPVSSRIQMCPEPQSCCLTGAPCLTLASPPFPGQMGLLWLRHRGSPWKQNERTWLPTLSSWKISCVPLDSTLGIQAFPFILASVLTFSPGFTLVSAWGLSPGPKTLPQRLPDLVRSASVSALLADSSWLHPSGS